MKKIIALMLCVSIALCFASCSSEKSTAEKTTASSETQASTTEKITESNSKTEEEKTTDNETKETDADVAEIEELLTRAYKAVTEQNIDDYLTCFSEKYRDTVKKNIKKYGKEEYFLMFINEIIETDKEYSAKDLDKLSIEIENLSIELEEEDEAKAEFNEIVYYNDGSEKKEVSSSESYMRVLKIDGQWCIN